MCGRYVIVETVEAIEKRFNVKASHIQLELNYNASPGQHLPVITNTDTHQVNRFQWGLTPFWADKPLYLINARSEEIVKKPSFRKPIRSQRCLVIASAFFEGNTTDKLSKPYLIYLQNKKRPFAMAGIWDTWVDKNKDETINTFCIITTQPNELMKKIGHDRMPVILNPQDEVTWLNSDAALTNITRLLRPFPAPLMNAYPISPEIKNPKNNYKELLQPIGERIFPEYDYTNVTRVYEKGWGGKKKQGNDEDQNSIKKREV